jgi:hypothetical protein
VTAAAKAHKVAQIARSLDLPTLRAALWAARSVHSLRASLPRDGLDAQVAAPPELPDKAMRGVEWLLSRVARPTCLERALILQSWMASHGTRRVVMVGVATDRGFEAHAWVRGYDDVGVRFSELAMIPPRAPR